MKRLLPIALLACLPLFSAAQDEPTPRRDPFETPRSVEEAARGPSRSAPGPRAAGLDLIVRGTLAVKGKQPAALLQHGKRTFLARAGQTLTLPVGAVKVESIQDGVVTVAWGRERLTLR